MPNPRFKGDNYSNFGGINVKVSPYQQGPQEFLDLKNLDFNIPGALTSRYGSTQYIQTSANFTGQIQSLGEFVRLSGSSMVVTSVSGGIWVGATTGQFQGLSLMSVGSTVSVSTGIAQVYQNLAGTSLFVVTDFASNPDQTFPYFPSPTPQFASAANPHSANGLDYVTFVNYLFMCDGTKFLKFDGVTTSLVGLPGAMAVGGLTGSVGVGSGGIAPSLFVPGTFTRVFGQYVNARGFMGPIWPLAAVDYTTQSGASVHAELGSTNISIAINVATPLAYGISGVNVFYNVQSPFSGYTYSMPGVSIMQLDSFHPLSSGVYAASGSTITAVSAFVKSNDVLSVTGRMNDYLPLGISNMGPSADTQVAAFFPRYMEIYSNRLFLAGFSTQLSTVWFSDTGEPEGYQADWNFEVRTNDGDRITALKAYGGNLAIWKFNSFHILSGDSPANFFVKELSDEYGCVSNRATEIFNDQLVFLDRKGIMRFNGAGLDCLSDKIQPVIDSINFVAATDNATMVHDKTKNQILLGVPVNGATFNNLTIVYDYLIGAWTTYDSYNPAVFAIMQGRLGQRGVFYGGYSGMLFNFGASLFGDNGVGFTCYLKTRFLHDMGESVSKQFRRLYLNTAPVASVTLPIQINFYQDYGASIVYSATMYQNAIQNRIDFGIPAKSLSFDLARNTPSLPIQIHGFAMEYRFQRNT